MQYCSLEHWTLLLRNLKSVKQNLESVNKFERSQDAKIKTKNAIASNTSKKQSKIETKKTSLFPITSERNIKG